MSPKPQKILEEETIEGWIVLLLPKSATANLGPQWVTLTSQGMIANGLEPVRLEISGETVQLRKARASPVPLSVLLRMAEWMRSRA